MSEKKREVMPKTKTASDHILNTIKKLNKEISNAETIHRDRREKIRRGGRRTTGRVV